MPSISVENYLKAIYHLQRRSEDRVKTKELAEHLGLSLPSATSMMKSLAESGHVTWEPYRGVLLTEKGQRAALRVIRNHRLVELFLVRTLGFSWDEVHGEAERLEHAISETLADRIDAFLGFPRVDPHGDPIPDREGRVDQPAGQLLAELEPGRTFRLVRVLEQDPEVLRYLDDLGLRPGAESHLLAREPFDGPLTLAAAGGERPLSRAIAKLLVVQPHDA